MIRNYPTGSKGYLIPIPAHKYKGCWRLRQRQGREGAEGCREALGALAGTEGPIPHGAPWVPVGDPGLGPEAAPPFLPRPPSTSGLPRAGRPPHLGWERPLGGGCGALLTVAEVGEDAVPPEPGGGRAHLGVAVAEAAAAAAGVVGLQVEGPWAASEMEAGHAQGPNEWARFRGPWLD